MQTHEEEPEPITVKLPQGKLDHCLGKHCFEVPGRPCECPCKGCRPMEEKGPGTLIGDRAHMAVCFMSSLKGR